ncbi:MAG: hypothetical protein L6R38_003614 [Xanthoria sp. 2 TBL-2021]|nr:MAG: hypothetical protein L6R38_003614 [Xanthoria sp. 2 TBL-2021]
MKLLTTVGLFSAANVEFSMVIRANASSAIPPTSSPSQPTLSLTASLQPVNLTHVKVSIDNTYPQDIFILTWNSHFQSDAEYGSFRVICNLDGTELKLQPGENMLQFNFIEAVPSDFVRIPTGGHHDGCYDLTRLFRVLTAGEYKVTLDLNTPAFLYSGGTTLEEALGESHPQAHDLSSLKIQSEPINMNLVESQPNLQRRAKRFRPDDCNGNQDVTNARNNAKDLARHAQGSGNAALWELYFNNGDQRATVSNAYQGVQNYDPAGSKYDFTEQCDFQNQDFDCRKNARIAVKRCRQVLSRLRQDLQRWMFMIARAFSRWLLHHRILQHILCST